jgi:hypothetical protein
MESSDPTLSALPRRISPRKAVSTSSQGKQTGDEDNHLSSSRDQQQLHHQHAATNNQTRTRNLASHTHNRTSSLSRSSGLLQTQSHEPQAAGPTATAPSAGPRMTRKRAATFAPILHTGGSSEEDHISPQSKLSAHLQSTERESKQHRRDGSAGSGSTAAAGPTSANSQGSANGLSLSRICLCQPEPKIPRPRNGMY